MNIIILHQIINLLMKVVQVIFLFVFYNGGCCREKGGDVDGSSLLFLSLLLSFSLSNPYESIIVNE